MGKVEFFLSCSDLNSQQVFVGVFLKDSATNKWKELGRTEVAHHTHPKFVHQFTIPYIVYEEQQIRCNVYRSPTGDTSLIPQNVIGSTAFKLAEVVSAKHQMLTRSLTRGRKMVKNRSTKRYSRLNVRLEPLNEDFVDRTAFTFRAEGLPKAGAFTKTNPLMEIHRLGTDGRFFKVFETIVVKKDMNPQWPEFTLTTAKLCNGDLKRALQFKIYHDDKGQRKYLGKCQTDYHRLVSDQSKAYALKDTKGKQIGTLHPRSKILERQQYEPEPQVASSSTNHKHQEQYQHAQNVSNAELEEKVQHAAILKLQELKSDRLEGKFLRYMQGGMELSLMVAIDFTGSNGSIGNDPKSLHNVSNPNIPSPYQSALRQICPLVAHYDSDQKFPVWGFGAKFDSQERVSHCFPVNPSGQEVDGVSGIEMAYVTAVQSNAFHLSGPCLYSHVLTKAINMTVHSHNEVMTNDTVKIQYYVLLILTNGQCDEKDKQATKDLIIYASNNNLPISIIFIGIGDKKFDFLEELDGDFEPIKDQKGQTAKRDIVQFVCLRDFALDTDKGRSLLAKETLKEVPIQFVGYVDNNGLAPRPVNAFALKRDESNAYLDDDGDDQNATPRHYKGDTQFEIADDEVDDDSDPDDNDDDEKGNEFGGNGSGSDSDAMANVPLPIGWSKDYTADGKVFYINHHSQTTQWTHPMKKKMEEQKTRNSEQQQTEMQKQQAALYNLQLMNRAFDSPPSPIQKPQQIIHQPIQRNATFLQPQQMGMGMGVSMQQQQGVQRTASFVTPQQQQQGLQPQGQLQGQGQYGGNVGIQKTGSLYQPQGGIQKTGSLYQPQQQQLQSQVQVQPPQQSMKTIYDPVSGRHVQIPSSSNNVMKQQASPQPIQYGGPQQVQQMQYGVPQNVNRPPVHYAQNGSLGGLGQGFNNNIQYGGPQQQQQQVQYGIPQQQGNVQYGIPQQQQQVQYGQVQPQQVNMQYGQSIQQQAMYGQQQQQQQGIMYQQQQVPRGQYRM